MLKTFALDLLCINTKKAYELDDFITKLADTPDCKTIKQFDIG